MKLRRDIFQGIADPTRRSILILLASQTMTAGGIANKFDVARPTISKHIHILSECGLIESDQQGREIHYKLKMDKMNELDIWLDQLRSIWEDRFDNLDRYLAKVKKSKK